MVRLTSDEHWFIQEDKYNIRYTFLLLILPNAGMFLNFLLTYRSTHVSIGACANYACKDVCELSDGYGL